MDTVRTVPTSRICAGYPTEIVMSKPHGPLRLLHLPPQRRDRLRHGVRRDLQTRAHLVVLHALQHAARAPAVGVEPAVALLDERRVVGGAHVRAHGGEERLDARPVDVLRPKARRAVQHGPRHRAELERRVRAELGAVERVCERAVALQRALRRPRALCEPRVLLLLALALLLGRLLLAPAGLLFLLLLAPTFLLAFTFEAFAFNALLLALPRLFLPPPSLGLCSLGFPLGFVALASGLLVCVYLLDAADLLLEADGDFCWGSIGG